MTPCGYDGYNFQYIGSRFYALDLWGDPDVGYDDQSEIDNEIYVSVRQRTSPHRRETSIMTPCSYDACNYQPSWKAFAALDLWKCHNFVDPTNKSAIDSHIYYRVERVACSVSIPTW